MRLERDSVGDGNLEIRGPRPYVDVRAFDAKGDGTTNDGTFFINAIASLLAQGGGKLFVPAGTYLIDTMLDINVPIVIEGAGSSATILTCDNTLTYPHGIPAR